MVSGLAAILEKCRHRFEYIVPYNFLKITFDFRISNSNFWLKMQRFPKYQTAYAVNINIYNNINIYILRTLILFESNVIIHENVLVCSKRQAKIKSLTYISWHTFLSMYVEYSQRNCVLFKFVPGQWVIVRNDKKNTDWLLF